MGLNSRVAVGVMTIWVAVMAVTMGAVEGLELSFADGRVTVIADGVPLRAILDEWSRLGGTEFVDSTPNGPSLSRQPVQIHLVDVAEREALRILLRDTAGFIAAPRTPTGTGVSRFDRVLVLATSRGPRGPAPASVAAPAPMPPPGQLGPRVAVPTDLSGIPQGATEDDAMESLRRILPQPIESVVGQPPADDDAPTAPRPGMPITSTDESAPAFIRPVAPQAGDR